MVPECSRDTFRLALERITPTPPTSATSVRKASVSKTLLMLRTSTVPKVGELFQSLLAIGSPLQHGSSLSGCPCQNCSNCRIEFLTRIQCPGSHIVLMLRAPSGSGVDACVAVMTAIGRTKECRHSPDLPLPALESLACRWISSHVGLGMRYVGTRQSDGLQHLVVYQTPVLVKINRPSLDPEAFEANSGP